MNNLILIILVLAPIVTHAETLSLASVWGQVDAKSAIQESSRLQLEALSEGEGRASRHWLPRLYLDAKGYQTDDPGTAFFGILEQRSLGSQDFNPESINQPETQFYTRGALGIDLGIYEGGFKSSQESMFQHSVAAQQNLVSQVELEQYSQVCLSYGSLSILQQQNERLQNLSNDVNRLIKAYKLGSRSNPVGYSGLLGMKSLANRIEGLINIYQVQNLSHYSALKEMGVVNQNWKPEVTDPENFIDKFFGINLKNPNNDPSFKLESERNNAKVSADLAKMERSKFLPQLGIFAEKFIFHGNRDTADGYSAGVYLRWSLFDPANYGSLKEAKLRSLASQKYSEALSQQEQTEKVALVETIKTLQQNMKLLDNSFTLLEEQSKVTRSLFLNGSITALQLVEVLNRKADLITQQSDTQLNYLKTASQLVVKEKLDITKYSGTGHRQ